MLPEPPTPVFATDAPASNEPPNARMPRPSVALLGLMCLLAPSPPAAAQSSLLPLVKSAADSAAPAETGTIRPMPVVLDASFRSAWTDDRLNGSLWSGRGLASRLQAGVSARWRFLTVAVQPEIVWAQNRSFPVVERRGSGPEGSSAPWQRIDLPRIWGPGSPTWVRPGNSSVTMGTERARLGVSTAVHRRGPGIHYPLLLGTSAPGFSHLFLEGAGSLPGVGRIAVRTEWGILQESEYFELGSSSTRSLLSGFFVDWSVPWTDGLTLGASYLYRDPIEDGLDPSLLFKAFGVSWRQGAEERAEDAILGLHALWRGPSFRVWATLGRGDHWLNAEDLLTEAGHSFAYSAGGMLAWGSDARRWTLHAEAVETARSFERGNTVYRHGDAGHTHAGQMLGAHVGPDGRAYFLGVTSLREPGTFGVELEQVRYDLDTYARLLDRRDGAAGEDREWRVAGTFVGTPPGVAPSGLAVELRVGVAKRWNRDYLPYADGGPPIGSSELNWIVDLGASWTPPWADATEGR